MTSTTLFRAAMSAHQEAIQAARTVYEQDIRLLLDEYEQACARADAEYSAACREVHDGTSAALYQTTQTDRRWWLDLVISLHRARDARVLRLKGAHEQALAQAHERFETARIALVGVRDAAYAQAEAAHEAASALAYAEAKKEAWIASFRRVQAVPVPLKIRACSCAVWRESMR